MIVGRALYVVVWLEGGKEIQLSDYFLNAISFFLAAFGSAGTAYAVVAENSSKVSRHTSRTASHISRHTENALIETFRSWNTAVFRPATRVVFGACYFCWFGTADGDQNMAERRIYPLTSHHTGRNAKLIRLTHGMQFIAAEFVALIPLSYPTIRRELLKLAQISQIGRNTACALGKPTNTLLDTPHASSRHPCSLEDEWAAS